MGRGVPAASAASVQPGREERLDLTAATRPLEFRTHRLSLDDDECRHRRDSEALDEVWPIFLCDAVEPEGLMVPTSLQNLSEESLGPPARAGHARMEEDQSGLNAGAHGRGGCGHANTSFAIPPVEVDRPIIIRPIPDTIPSETFRFVTGAKLRDSCAGSSSPGWEPSRRSATTRAPRGR